MRRGIRLLLFLAMVIALTACSQAAVSEDREEGKDTAQNAEEGSGTFRDGTQTVKQETEEQPDTGMEPEMPVSVPAGEQEADVNTKTLVVYFSCTGTTKLLAEYAAEILEADLYEITAQDPYTEADLAYYTNGRADREQNDPDVRPAISGSVENMEEYDTILLGYPIWHGQAPRIISTFLESYDLSGKTILPFCTSHSSGMGSSADDLQALCSDSTYWMEGKRFGSETTREALEEWLCQRIGVWISFLEGPLSHMNNSMIPN